MFGVMETYKQWIVYKLVPNGDKTDKIPIDVETGGKINPHDVDTWKTYSEVLDITDSLGTGYGAGFVLTDRDPFFFIDIDSCLTPSGWNYDANYLCSIFPGCFKEVSQSGAGLHIIGSWSGGVTHRCKCDSPKFDLYTKLRFIALTGLNAQGDPGVNVHPTLSQLIAALLAPSATQAPEEWTTEPVDGWQGPADDSELIDLALKSKGAGSILGVRCSFRNLWERDISALSTQFPPDGNDTGEYDDSRADAALAQHLAFWTGKNCERTRSIMFMSELVRGKWDRHDYLERTILKACSQQKDVFGTLPALRGGTQKQRAVADNIRERLLNGVNSEIRTTLTAKTGPAASPAFWLNNSDKPVTELARMVTPLTSGTVTPDADNLVSGYQYMPVDLQLEHFKGCTYISDIHRIATPDGQLLRTEQFNALYGGYVFQLDEMGDKTTRKPWEVFTESQAVRFPKVHTSCFSPTLNFGTVSTSEDGNKTVNLYRTIDTPCIEGDVTPFTEHLAKLLPNDIDRLILLSYMAAVVQYPGVKFQWCPLVQGTEGNGKTLLTRCVVKAIGKKYAHFPKSNDLDNKFNGWMLNKILIAVEDIFVSENRLGVLEALKPMITGDTIEIQMKGVDQVTADICCNFMLNSNHQDAIRKTMSDRRFAVFFTAQQSRGDLRRDGMGGSYFPELYKWLNKGGYANVTYYLKHYDIPDVYNPATQCHRAPDTSSTLAAVSSGLGGVEQEILEAIEEERTGFKGGWISSVALDRLLKEVNRSRSIPHNKRREILNSLGYDWHPGLNQGRVNNPVFVDGGKKPRLFIRSGHETVVLTVPADIVQKYIEAQEKGAN